MPRLPPNYETPELLLERHKPRLQRSFQETAAASFGPVPFTGPEAPGRWLQFLDLYIKLQLEVDRHIGHVLRTLESRPEVAANTVIVFTSDHGEYGASHGLRGKGASGYEEGIRVPLIVKDPRGVLTRAPAAAAHAAHLERRRRAAAADDRAPARATGAASRTTPTSPAGSTSPRSSPTRTAPGRRYVLHATDETVTEFAIEPYAADAPLHVVALRTPRGQVRDLLQLARRRASSRSPTGRKPSCTTTARRPGASSCTTAPATARSKKACSRSTSGAFADELRAPLPARLVAAHARGFADYFSTARNAATSAAARRKRRSEREVGPLAGAWRPARAPLRRGHLHRCARSPMTRPERVERLHRHVGRGDRRRQRDRRLEARPRGAAHRRERSPARLRRARARRRLRVAPFQLAYTTRAAVRRRRGVSATAGGSAGCPLQGKHDRCGRTPSRAAGGR